MKTRLVNLPIDPAESQKVISSLSELLTFWQVVDLYSYSRHKESKLDGASTLELSKLRQFHTEYGKHKNKLDGQLQEENAEKETNDLHKQEIIENLHTLKPEVEKLLQLDAEVAFKIFLSLATGVKVAADYLVEIFNKEYGVVKNDFLTYLCMAINVKLGNKDATEIISNDALADEAKKLADKCIVQIQDNTIGGGNITYQEAIGYGKALDKVVKDHLGVSFEEYILPSTIKEYAQFVELIKVNGNKVVSHGEMLKERLYSQVKKGEELFNQGLYIDALNIFDDLTLKYTDIQSIYLQSLTWKAECLYKLDKFPEALDCYNKISDINKADHNWGKKASCLWKMVEFTQAYQCCEKGLELNGKDALCLSVKIDCFTALKKYEKAIEYCDELLQIEHSVITLQKKVFCLMILGKFNEAINLVDTLNKLDPKNVATWCFVIVYQCGFEQYESALSLCTTAEAFAASDKDKKKVLGHKILLLNKLERYAEAITCVNTLLLMNLNNKNSLTYKEYFSLGELMNYNQVMSDLENAFKHKPHNKKVALSLALVRVIQMEKEEKNKEALENIDRALELIGDNSESRKLVVVYKAHILNAMDKYQEAIECSDEVINVDQNFIPAWEEKAIAYLNLGDKEESKKIYTVIHSKKAPAKRVDHDIAEVLYFPDSISKQEPTAKIDNIES